MFTHLHVHTEYSLLDGAARIKEVVARAKELGMNALAITDHGAMFGVIDFYKECKKQGIKPIIGCEVYMAARGMEDKDPDLDRNQTHLLLLAENDEGYHNLCKIVSEGYVKGMYYKPRVDKDVLRKYSKGIIATSACIIGKVQQLLLARDYEGAKQEAMEMDEIFGHGNFFLEIQDQGLDDEKRINPEIIRLGRELDLGLVATNDVHYIRREDAEMHDVLLAIQTATSINDEKRMRFPNDEFYLKSEEEMREIFSNIPEAIENTNIIADRCNVEFTFGEYHLPEFYPPEGYTNPEYLRRLCEEGLKERYGQGPEGLSGITKEHRERMEYELSVIESMGYVEYYLIVWDFINFAKSQGIMVGPGRGSGAASIVAYCLKITNIDPIKYSLIFERFLNPERISMPDFDIDFCIERRGEVIEYVKEKYGSECVSQIITFGTMKAKAAVRDVARALDLTYVEGDRIAKAIPFSLDMTLDKALSVSPELNEMYQQDVRVRKVIDMSRKIEGMPRNAGTHAAGVVISKLPLDEYLPLYSSEKGVATQFNMTTVEELGLLKMDFLGLRNLTVIRDALELIKENHGVDIDFDKMGYDDPAVYEMISEGNTDGVFQLESAGMTSFMKNLRPGSFEDVVAGIALYRPGPMDSIPRYIENKKDPDKIKYVTPELAPILDVTYGCLVYQEQVMQIVRDLAGYSYGRSDLVRRAMSKKKADVMAEEKKWFIYGKEDEAGNIEVPGCIRNGISEEAAEAIFSDMESFAQYAFNKAHAAAYGVVAFQTGYLKKYFPVEFMAALMTSVMGDSAAIAKYIGACRELGIEVLPPSITESQRKFSVTDGKIRFGLQAVKNVGEGAIEAIIKTRNEKGAPKDIFTWINDIDTSVVNKKALESLIKAGACDMLGGNRAALLGVYEGLLESAQQNARKNIAGQISLFQMEGAEDLLGQDGVHGRLPDIKDFDDETRLALEKELTGVYITDHPLNRYVDKIDRFSTINAGQLMQIGREENDSENEEHEEALLKDRTGKVLQDGDRVVLLGMISGKRNLITKSSKMMSFLQVEDLHGTCEVVVFPNVYEKCNDCLVEDKVVVVVGHLDFKEGEQPKILADNIMDADYVKEIEAPVKNFRKFARDKRSNFDGGANPGSKPNLERNVNSERKSNLERNVNSERKPNLERNVNSERKSNLDGAVKIRIPLAGDNSGRAGEMEEEQVMEKLKEIFSRYEGNVKALIYKRDGKIIATGEGKGIRPTLDFAEEVALLCGNANIKIRQIAR